MPPDDQHNLFLQLLENTFKTKPILIRSGTPAVSLGPFLVSLSSNNSIPARVTLHWGKPNDSLQKSIHTYDIIVTDNFQQAVTTGLQHARNLIIEATQALPKSPPQITSLDAARAKNLLDINEDLQASIDRITTSLLKRPELAFHVGQELNYTNFAAPWSKDHKGSDVRLILSHDEFVSTNNNTYAATVQKDPNNPGHYNVTTTEAYSNTSHPQFTHRNQAKDYADQILKEAGWFLMPTAPRTASPWQDSLTPQGTRETSRYWIGIDHGSPPTYGTIAIVRHKPSPKGTKQEIVTWLAFPDGPKGTAQSGSRGPNKNPDTAWNNAKQEADNILASYDWILKGQP